MGSISDQQNKDVLQMKNGAVTLLDVLGWKGIWQRKPDAIDVLKSMRDLMKDLQGLIVAESQEWAGLETEILSFSDTIVIATYGEPEMVLPLHIRLTDHFLDFCFVSDLPLRGAIGYGLFSLMENMLIGPAVDEVASWYEAVDWIGAILTPSASFYYQEKGCNDECVLEYEVHLKKGGRYAMMCLDWFAPFKDEKDLLEHFLKTTSVITPAIAPKYLNTVEFFRHIRKAAAAPTQTLPSEIIGHRASKTS